MSAQEERKEKIKQLIEKRPGIHHTALLEMITNDDIMAKKTAEKIIGQLINDLEISVVKQKKRKCYFLKAYDMFKGNLPEAFSNKIRAMKEELESMENNFETHSYDAQCQMCDELCASLMDRIERSKEYVKELDREYDVDKYYYDYQDFYSKVTKLLRNNNVDNERRHKILDYLRNAESVAVAKSRDMIKLDEKRKNLKQSKKRDEIHDQVRQLNLQIDKIWHGTTSIVDALQSLQTRAIRWECDGSELGQCYG